MPTVTLYSGELSATASPGDIVACSVVISPAVNCSGLTKENGTLVFEAKCSVPANLDSSKENQLEISSAGTSNSHEWNVSWLDKITLTTSYAEYSVSLASASTTGGELNTAAINWFRMYAYVKTGSTTLYVKNIRLQYVPAKISYPHDFSQVTRNDAILIGGNLALPFSWLQDDFNEAKTKFNALIDTTSITPASLAIPISGDDGKLDNGWLKPGAGSVTPQQYGAKGDGSTDDTTALQDAIDATPEGGTLFIPSTSNYYKISNKLTVSKAMEIVGESNTRAIIEQSVTNKGGIEITASNVTVRNLCLRGYQYSSYTANEKALYIHGSNSSNYLDNIKIIGCYITRWGNTGIYSEYVKNFWFIRNRMYQLNYAGILALSVSQGDIGYNIIDTIGPGISGNAYGIALTRDSDKSITAAPCSERVNVHNNQVYNNTVWEAYDTHAGQYINFTDNMAYGCKIGIMVGSCNNEAGNETYAPFYCTVTGNIVDSGVRDGSKEYGIVIAGAYSGNTVQQFATGCSAVGNVIMGFGNQSSSIGCSVYIYGTLGLSLSGNVIRYGGSNGILLYHNNYDVSVTGGSIIDIFTNTSDVGEAIGINVYSVNQNFVISDVSIAARVSMGTYLLDTPTGKAIYVGDQTGVSGKLGRILTNATTLLYDPGERTTWPLDGIGTYTPGDTTPDVRGVKFMAIYNSSPTTITNFDGGVTGQVITLLFGDSNTTVDTTYCYLLGGSYFDSTYADTLVLVKQGIYWYELSRSSNE